MTCVGVSNAAEPRAGNGPTWQAVDTVQTARQQGKGTIVGVRIRAAMLALIGSAAAGVLVQFGSSAVSSAQPPPPPCPYGMYWDVYTVMCVPVDTTVYVNPPNPVVGPVGPVGVGGVVGPVGVGPVGPAPWVRAR